MEKVAKEMKISVEDVKEQFSQERFDSLFLDDVNFEIENLQEDDYLNLDEGEFAVVGRMDGYWGLKWNDNMVVLDRNVLRDKLKKGLKENKTNIIEDLKEEDMNSKSDFIYQASKSLAYKWSLDEVNLDEVVTITPEYKEKFKKLNTVIEGIINDFESTDRWVETILANEYVERPLTPIEKAQQEPTQKKLDEPYYMEGHIPLRNTGGQIPPPQ